MSYRKLVDIGEKKEEEKKRRIEIQEIFCKQDKDALIKDNKVLIVDVYADWCHPCKIAESFIGDLSEEYKDFCKFAKEQVELMLSESVQVIPTFQVYYEGKLVKIITGPDKEAIESEVQKYVFKDVIERENHMRRRKERRGGRREEKNKEGGEEAKKEGGEEEKKEGK